MDGRTDRAVRAEAWWWHRGQTDRGSYDRRPVQKRPLLSGHCLCVRLTTPPLLDRNSAGKNADGRTDRQGSACQSLVVVSHGTDGQSQTGARTVHVPAAPGPSVRTWRAVQPAVLLVDCEVLIEIYLIFFLSSLRPDPVGRVLAVYGGGDSRCRRPIYLAFL